MIIAVSGTKEPIMRCALLLVSIALLSACASTPYSSTYSADTVSYGPEQAGGDRFSCGVPKRAVDSPSLVW